MNKNILPLTLGGLGIGTTEFVMMGMLPDVARDFSISIPEAGHLISAYALGVVIGAPLLVVHGAGGGFDQGLEFAGSLPRRGFRVIAMSRFGYLRTPLPDDASPIAQADAHACLLDALGIERTAIMGGSAGAPSAMQFAIRHPDRCNALVLLVVTFRRAQSAQSADASAVG